MNLMLVKKLTHDDLRRLLKQAQDKGKNLIRYDEKDIHWVMEQVKIGGEHHWCGILFESLLTAARIFNKMLHILLVFLMLIILLFVVVVGLHIV